MKKLKSKLFITIFSILSIFIITILGIFNYQEYYRAKETVESNLSKINNEKPNNKIDPNIDSKEKLEDATNPPPIDTDRKFLDATIYTVIINDENEIIDIISQVFLSIQPHLSNQTQK